MIPIRILKPVIPETILKYCNGEENKNYIKNKYFNFKFFKY